MKQLDKSITAIWFGGVCSGFVLGIILAYFINDFTLDTVEQLKRRAIKARVAEMYLNNKLELKFRYLTEHKIDALDIHEE